MKSTYKALDVERKCGHEWLRMDCHTADNTRILDMLALVRAGKISVGECFTFRDGQTFRTVRKFKYKMFVDYDRCLKRGREQLCRNCTKEQQQKCQKKVERHM